MCVWKIQHITQWPIPFNLLYCLSPLFIVQREQSSEYWVSSRFLSNTVKLYFLTLPSYTVSTVYTTWHEQFTSTFHLITHHLAASLHTCELGHTWGGLWASYWGLMCRIIWCRKILTNHRQNKGLRKSYFLPINHSRLNRRKGQPDLTDFPLRAVCFSLSQPCLSGD